MEAPSRMNKHEIRAELLSHGLTPDELDRLSRPVLIARLNEYRRTARGEKPAPSKPKEQVDPPPADGRPRMTDNEWVQYVMGLFEDEEMENTSPRVDGLRRVAELLIGEIIEEGCELVAPPTIENGQRACVKAWAVFKTHKVTKRFEGLADVSLENCSEEFARFPTSTAETRAKGRCFRAALKLRRIVAAEELNDSPSMDGQGASEAAIHSGLISVVQIMADRLHVSIPKLLEHLEIGKNELRSLTQTEGKLVAKHLNGFQQAGHIPPSLIRAGG